MTDSITETDSYFYEPRRGHGLAHDPIGSIVAPRPIGWISTHDGAGHNNLAPYSFFNLLNYRPPIIGFASSGRKDTLRNAQRSGDFVCNLVTRALAERMNATSATVDAGVDEFALAGLTAASSVTTRAPRVAESPINLECRVCRILRLCDARGTAIPSWLVIGEVVGVHIARHLLRDRAYVTTAAHPVVRGGGRTDYFEIGADTLFRLIQPE